MSEKIISIGEDGKGVFSVSEGSSDSKTEVLISAYLGEIKTVAVRVFDEKKNPKICAALVVLKQAMLEEGGEKIDVVKIG
ncbi:MAG: hypothetical protein V1804_00035 [Patescibacteria group bacterium]